MAISGNNSMNFREAGAAIINSFGKDRSLSQLGRGAVDGADRVWSFVSKTLSSAVDGLKKLPTMFRSENRALAALESRRTVEADVRPSLMVRIGRSLSEAREKVAVLFGSAVRSMSLSSGSDESVNGESRVYTELTPEERAANQAANQNRAKEYTDVDARVAKFKDEFPDCDAGRVEQVVTMVTEKVGKMMEIRDVMSPGMGLGTGDAEIADTMISFMLDGDGKEFDVGAISGGLNKCRGSQFPATLQMALDAIVAQDKFIKEPVADRCGQLKEIYRDLAAGGGQATAFLRVNPKAGSKGDIALNTLRTAGADYFQAMADKMSIKDESLTPPAGNWDGFKFNTERAVGAIRGALDPNLVPDDLCKLYASVEAGVQEGAPEEHRTDFVNAGLNDAMMLRTLTPQFAGLVTADKVETANVRQLGKMLQWAANGTGAKTEAENAAISDAMAQVKEMVSDYKTAVLERGRALLATDAPAAAQTPAAAGETRQRTYADGTPVTNFTPQF